MNYGQQIESTNQMYTEHYYNLYMGEKWGIEYRRNIVAEAKLHIRKILGDWQVAQDCNNLLCPASQEVTITVITESTTGTPPLPQI